MLYLTSTPRVIAAVVRGAEARIEREAQAATTQAWMTAQLTAIAMTNPKAFPPLGRILPRREARRRDADEDFARLMSWAKGEGR